MKKIIAMGLAIVLLLSLGVGSAFAADQNPNASAKATALIGGLDIRAVAQADDPPFDIDGDFDGSLFSPIMTQKIKTSNAKDLFIDLALQTGCYTTTVVKSKNMQKDTSLGSCQIWVWITVDGIFGERVYPRFPIIFDSRIQKLSATLQGEINFDVDGHMVSITNPEIIELFIGTMSAHSFNFIVEDLEAGMHTVRVYVWATTLAMSQQGSAEAIATVGLGSMTIEEVRMVKGDDITDMS
jgi:hypothetical protein